VGVSQHVGDRLQQQKVGGLLHRGRQHPNLPRGELKLGDVGQIRQPVEVVADRLDQAELDECRGLQLIDDSAHFSGCAAQLAGDLVEFSADRRLAGGAATQAGEGQTGADQQGAESVV
jgi:hypothetical protein